MRKTEQTAKNETSAAEVESIEALLGELDLGDETVEIEALEEIVEEDLAELELSEEADDAELRDLELQIEREEVYSEQESDTDADAGAVAIAKEERKKNPIKVKGSGSKAKTTGTPRVARDLNAVAGEFFVLEGDVSAMSDADKDAAKATTMTLVPTQKKIAEKFENLFTSIAAGRQPSVYVVQAFKLLDEKKVVASADIVATFKGSYSQGTSMSQAGQIMNLFAAVKIADRTKSSLTLNENSVVAQRIRDVIAAAKAS